MTRLPFLRILQEIPEYPSAVSAAVLALNLGYVPKTRNGGDGLEIGMRRLERQLMWLTAAEPRLIERRTVIQDATVTELLRNGIGKDAIPEEMSYISLAAAGRASGRESDGA